jgi:magnesium chelatase subunit D
MTASAAGVSAPDSARTSAWADAALAAALFAVDPAGLGGVALRCSAGPVRDRWTGLLRTLLPEGSPLGRMPLGVEDDRLLGGLDLSATLASGRPVMQRGLLAACDGGVLIAPMAERIELEAAAKLAAVLDTGVVQVEREGMTGSLAARIGLVVLDEGAAPEERPPEALMERLAFRFDLDAISPRADLETLWTAEAVAAARTRHAAMAPPAPAVIEALCTAAALFGLTSARPPLLALRAACAHAALLGRERVTAEDAAIAARLVLAPRAVTVPAELEPQREAAPDEAEPPPPDPAADASDSADEPSDVEPSDADLVLAAVKAALPDDLLERVAMETLRATRARGRGFGAATKAARRGRPLGARAGAMRPGDRLDLPATLRAAAPWRRLRAGGRSQALVEVRREDFRIRRFVQRQEGTTIFVVDASGSAALQRLAEAKGAVELLLAKAYVSRARVALIAFRNTGAELLLPPTRSLTRAKRSLAELPGGGGTPLACGLEAALALAEAERARDRTPLMVILTDGRANIDREGAPGRAAAERDAILAAERVGAAGVGAVFIDTSSRPQPEGDRFARAMGGVYAPLPYLDAGKVSGLVEGLSKGRR